MEIKLYLIVLFFGTLLGLNLARLLIVKISRTEVVEDEKKARSRESMIRKVLSRVPEVGADKQKVKTDSSVLEKKILYEDELNRILQIEQEISANAQLADVSRVIVENAMKTFGVDRCVLLLLDPETKILKIQYSIGLIDEDINSTSLKLGEGLSGYVAERNQMMAIEDVKKEFWSKGEKEYYYTGPLVSIPLTTQNMVFGVLNIDRKKTGEVFNDDDIRFIKSLAVQSAIAIQNARLYEEVQEGYLRTIMALAEALDAKDPYTHKHSENVTRFAVAIAEEQGLSLSEIEKIRRSGLMHDIGKIGIKDDILTKPGKLTDEEFEQIKTHPEKGESILRSLPFLEEISKIVRHHHERYNGAGYPDKLKGYQIESGAKILAVADAFDAMVSDRPYRKALSLEIARGELERNSGTQFDPAAVEAFLKVLQKNPNIIKS